jgi:hypothetical protein
MAPSAEITVLPSGFGRATHWQGRSGRVYDLLSENLEHFSVAGEDLFLVAKGGHALWVGSSEDLVSDPMSRTRFRLALDCADRAFRVRSSGAPNERLSTVWDLEGAAPLQSRSRSAA